MTVWIASTDVSRDASRQPRRDVARPTRIASARAAFVPAWTGRAATSRATASRLPHLITAGTHRTRVSEMRFAAALDGRRPVTGVSLRPAAVAPAIAERRDLARKLPEHHGSGV